VGELSAHWHESAVTSKGQAPPGGWPNSDDVKPSFPLPPLQIQVQDCQLEALSLEVSYTAQGQGLQGPFPWQRVLHLDGQLPLARMRLPGIYLAQEDWQGDFGIPKYIVSAQWSAVVAALWSIPFARYFILFVSTSAILRFLMVFVN